MMVRSPRRGRVASVLVCAVAAATVVVGLAVQPSPAAEARLRAPHDSKAITPDQAPRVTKRYFGMHVPAIVKAFPQAPIGAVDLTTNQVYWPQIETSPGHFDFTRLDATLAQAESHGASTLLVLGGTPSFHSTTPEQTPSFPTVPHMKAWKAYVRAVVEKYGTRLEYQVWIEPNVTNNWAGTPQQLANRIVAAAKIIHHVAPGSVVVAPPMVLRLRYQRRFMKTFFTTEVDGVPVGHYVDAVSIDPYPRQDGTPETAFSLTARAQRILAADNVSAPLWIVEINYGVPVGGGGVATVYSGRTQASYVARTYLLDAALGVRRVYWLGWLVYPTLGVNLVEPDLVTARAAGRAFSLIHTWLLGQRPRGCWVDQTRDLYSCAFTRDGHTSWAYWTTSGSTRVRAPATLRTVVRATGRVSATRAGEPIRVTSVPIWVTH